MTCIDERPEERGDRSKIQYNLAGVEERKGRGAGCPANAQQVEERELSCRRMVNKKRNLA